MIDELKHRLDAIVGDQYNYKGNNVTVDKYKFVGGTNVVIFLNDRPHNLLLHEVDDFLSDLSEPVIVSKPGLTVALPKRETIVYEPTKESESVKASLMEVLQKVKEDPSYIPQAKAVCDVVNQIVNVQKTEVQMLEIIAKANENR